MKRIEVTLKVYDRDMEGNDIEEFVNVYSDLLENDQVESFKEELWRIMNLFIQEKNGYLNKEDR